MNASDRAILEAVLRNDRTAFTQRCFQAVVPGQQLFAPVGRRPDDNQTTRALVAESPGASGPATPPALH